MESSTLGVLAVRGFQTHQTERRANEEEECRWGIVGYEMTVFVMENSRGKNVVDGPGLVVLNMSSCTTARVFPVLIP